MKDSNYYNEKETTYHLYDDVLSRIKRLKKDFNRLIFNFKICSEYFINNYDNSQIKIQRKLNLQKKIYNDYLKSINFIDDFIN